MPETKNCIVCKKSLEMLDAGCWQPIAGGEVQFIFSYGSEKFDRNSTATVFRGVVCDDCAETLIDENGMTETAW